MNIALVNVATPTMTTMACTRPSAIGRVVALGAARVGGSDQLVVWYERTPGVAELAAFSVVVAADACALTQVGAVDTALSAPSRSDYPVIEGARIVSIAGTEAVAISDPGKGLVSIYSFGATPGVQTFAAPAVSSLAVGKIGADTYVFAGASNQDVDGVSNAGRVQAFKLSGVAPAQTPELTLHDASPDTEQRFGRAVAVVPFTDASSPIIAVGADDELFTYFRTGLYDERRAR
jgi:hypothetical protein